MSSSATQATVDRVLDHLRDGLIDIESKYRAQGRSVADMGIAELAQRMVALVPMPSPVNDSIGPFYRGKQVAKLLNVTRQAVHERAKSGSLLALRTADELWVYPTYQFDQRGLIPGLANVLTEFRGGQFDRWAIAAWLVSPTAALDGVTPLQALRSVAGRVAALDLARETAARWAG